MKEGPFTDREIEKMWRENSSADQQVAFERALQKGASIEAPQHTKQNILRATSSVERPAQKTIVARRSKPTKARWLLIAVPACSVLLLAISFSMERRHSGRVTMPGLMRPGVAAVPAASEAPFNAQGPGQIWDDDDRLFSDEMLELEDEL